MEKLPNELWLLIYSYLHNIDILYSFNNLNNRFQQILITYQYDIDLRTTSFELSQRFVRHILPVYGQKIRSLILKNNYQLQFCIQNKLFHSLNNLQCLTLMADRENHLRLDHSFFSEHLKHLFKLKEFHIFSWFNVFTYDEDITSFTSLPLTSLTLVHSIDSLNWTFPKCPPNLKILKIRLPNLSAFDETTKYMNNLCEMYLTVSDLNDDYFESNYNSRHDDICILPSLVKLHLELKIYDDESDSSIHILKKF